MGKWTTPLGLKVPLIPISAQISPQSLVQALLEATVWSYEPAYSGFSRWEADQLAQLAANIRAYQDNLEANRETTALPDHMDDVRTDTDRVDWIERHPCNLRWNRKRGWIVEFGIPFGEAEGATLRAALDAAFAMTARATADVYGTCPHCGAPGKSRERRPNGNDTCASGHVYPSSAAVSAGKERS